MAEASKTRATADSGPRLDASSSDDASPAEDADVADVVERVSRSDRTHEMTSRRRGGKSLKVVSQFLREMHALRGRKQVSPGEKAAAPAWHETGFLLGRR